MKKFIVLFLAAAAMVLGTAVSSMAVEVNTYGYFRAFSTWVDNHNFDEDDDGEDNSIAQRLRTFFEFEANENLSATLGLEYDNTWGRDSGGDGSRAGTAGMDIDSNIEIKRYYLDFNWPDSDVSFRIGAQGYALPGGSMGEVVAGSEIASIVISSPINDMVGLSFGFMRPLDEDGQIGGGNGRIDAYFASLPIEGRGWNLNPFGLYAYIDDSVTTGGLAAAQTNLLSITQANTLSSSDESVEPYEDTADAFWVGTDFGLDLLDPWRLKASFVYGSVSADEDINDREGWFADFVLDYRMDNMTPSLFGMYWSGEDDDPDDGSESMPYLFNDGYYNPPTNTAFGKNSKFNFSENNYGLVQIVPHSLWQIGFALKDIKFMEKLTSTAGISYGQGTNDKDVAGAGFRFTHPIGGPYSKVLNGDRGQELTEDDSFYEIRLDNHYQVYENLKAILELGYVSLDMDSDWDAALGVDDYLDDEAFMVNFGFSYDF